VPFFICAKIGRLLTGEADFRGVASRRRHPEREVRPSRANCPDRPQWMNLRRILRSFAIAPGTTRAICLQRHPGNSHERKSFPCRYFTTKRPERTAPLVGGYAGSSSTAATAAVSSFTNRRIRTSAFDRSAGQTAIEPPISSVDRINILLSRCGVENEHSRACFRRRAFDSRATARCKRRPSTEIIL
jgi:hypothetical protein